MAKIIDKSGKIVKNYKYAIQIQDACLSKSGNIKLGNETVYSWSKLAGNITYIVNASNGAFVCKGTCGNFCNGCGDLVKDSKGNYSLPSCYVFKSYRYSSVVASQMRNTIAMRNDMDGLFLRFYWQIKKAKKKPTIVRINQSGEIESKEEFSHWCDLAKQFPDIKFWIYSKAFQYINVEEMPENMFLNVSVWHEYGVSEYFTFSEKSNQVNAFVYDDGYDYSSKGLVFNTRCNAYKGGKLNHSITCKKCGKCFKKSGVIACEDH